MSLVLLAGHASQTMVLFHAPRRSSLKHEPCPPPHGHGQACIAQPLTGSSNLSGKRGKKATATSKGKTGCDRRSQPTKNTYHGLSHEPRRSTEPRRYPTPGPAAKGLTMVAITRQMIELSNFWLGTFELTIPPSASLLGSIPRWT